MKLPPVANDPVFGPCDVCGSLLPSLVPLGSIRAAGLGFILGCSVGVFLLALVLVVVGVE